MDTERKPELRGKDVASKEETPVKVSYYSITKYNAWVGEAEHVPLIPDTVAKLGWLLYQDSEVVVIAAEKDAWWSSVGEITIIPKGCITNIDYI